ncbi:MAG: hypothetical protein AAFU60_09310, partial [Bacteroidota bacterium]
MKKTLQTLTVVLLLLTAIPGWSQLHFEKDFATRPGISYYGNWVEIDEKMYFAGNNIFYGIELWQFDPSTDQAMRLTDINPLGAGSYPSNITKYQGAIYFTAWRPENNWQIYKIDPQTLALEIVSTAEETTFQPNNMIVYQDKLWFTASNGTSYNLWSYDGNTEAFTEYDPPANGHQDNFAPQAKYVFEGKLLLNAYNPNFLLELWSFDGETGSYTKVPTQFDGQQNLPISSYSQCRGELMLNLSGNWHHYDAEQDSCIFLETNNSGTFRGGHCLQDRFWYPSYNNNDIKCYDPATGTVELLKDLHPDAPFAPEAMKVIGDDLFIWETAAGPNYRLYRYNPAEQTMETLFQDNSVFINSQTLLEDEDGIYYFGEAIDREIYKFHKTEETVELIAD